MAGFDGRSTETGGENRTPPRERLVSSGVGEHAGSYAEEKAGAKNLLIYKASPEITRRHSRPEVRKKPAPAEDSVMAIDPMKNTQEIFGNSFYKGVIVQCTHMIPPNCAPGSQAMTR
jgi:hypothetical protein